MNLANSNAPATKKQLFALFCGTGLNTVNCIMSVRQASNLIDNMKNGCDIETDLRSFGATGQVKESKKDWKSLFEAADKAGKEAAAKHIPTPMVVQQRSNPLDDNSTVIMQEIIYDGVCGFAEVVVKPGNSPFANYLKKNKIGQKRYNGGVGFYVHHYGQSMELKAAYASAFAKTLNENGVKAHSESRMD